MVPHFDTTWSLSISALMAHRVTYVLVPLLFFCALWSGHAQSLRLGDAYYLKLGRGLTDFAGDAGARAGVADLYDVEKFVDSDRLQYVLSSELGYQFTAGFSTALGYQYGTYYFIRGQQRELHTVQLLGRYGLGGRSWRVSPYVDIGVNATKGLQRIGLGPTMGGGLDIVVNDRISLTLESRVNLTFPDHAVDGHGGEGIPFDVLSQLPSFGAKLTLTSSATPPDVLVINGPSEVEAGEEITFRAAVNEEKASRPLAYEWTFGNGGTGSGRTATHTFPQGGTYTVWFEASNEAGRASESVTVNVRDPAASLQIASMEVAPNPSTVDQDVHLYARVDGGEPASYEWDLGDGTSATGPSPTHTYSEPGEYTVQLTVSNDVETDTRTQNLRVNESAERVMAGPYTVQVGAFTEEENAERRALRALSAGYRVRVRSALVEGGILYRVYAGSFQSEEEAERHVNRFRAFAPDAFATRADTEEETEED